MSPRPNRTQNAHGVHASSRRVLAAGAVALVLALGTSCAATEPPAPLGSDDLASLQRAERIINTEVTAEENALLINAHGAVTEACMQELGWDFRVATATPELAEGGPSTMSPLERWTFADVPAAQSDGYGFEAHLADVAAFRDRIAEDDAEVHIPDPSTMTPEDAARFDLDYGGTEEQRVEIVERDGSTASVAGGGCLGEAQRAVWGDIEEDLRLRDARDTAESDIWAATFGNDAVADAQRAWKDCVAAQGFEFEDPPEAFDAALTAAQAGDYAEERSIATTDAQCKAETGLDRAVEAAFLMATNAVLPDLEDDLLALQQFEAEALARAKEILRSGGE